MGVRVLILLDTHAWIWYVTESTGMSPSLRNRIKREDEIGVSAISCWEVAMLVMKKRIGFNIDVLEWIQRALEFPNMQLLPIDPGIAVLSTRLPGEFHDDPADRIIVATSLYHGADLVTKDVRIQSAGLVKTVW